MRNVPVNSQQMEVFKMNPYNGKTIGGLNGDVPNRRDRRSSRRGSKKISSTKIPKGSPYRLTYIKNMNLKAAIEKYSFGLIDSEKSPKVINLMNKIKNIRAIREIKQRISENKGTNNT